MPESYPISLQDNFNRGSFQRTLGSNKVYSEMDTGPSKVRRRSTIRKDLISGSILLKDNSEYSDFIDFYTSTLQDWALSFYFDDPALGNQMVVRFTEGSPLISDVGFQVYSVTMNLEVISE